MLVMFEDFKRQVELDSNESRNKLLALQDDVKEIKEKQTAVSTQSYSWKKLPCDISVRWTYHVYDGL